MSRKEEITKKIQQAAIDEFLQKGLDSGSMESIAKKADVSKRTLYKYYSNKDTIFDDIISLLLESFKLYSKFVYEPDQTIEDQIDKILKTKIELVTSDEYMKISKLVLSEILKSRELRPDHLEELYASEQKFINWIEEAKKDKAVKSEISSELIANQFHSILKGQIFYPVLFGFAKLSKKELEESRKITRDFFINTFCR